MQKLDMKSHTFPGRFCCIEGGEFAGKTSLLKPLKGMLEWCDYSVCVTKEPTNTNLFGQTVRAIYQLKDPHNMIEHCISMDSSYDIGVDEHTQTFITLGTKLLQRKLDREDLLSNPTLHMFLQLGMIFDRALHYHDTVIPALKRGEIVLSDRCAWSTLAYAKANNIDWQYLVKVHNDRIGFNFIQPDILLFLDVSLKAALERKKKRGSDELFEREPQMRRNLEVYREMYGQKLFPTAFRVNADNPELDVIADSWSALSNVLLAM